MDKKHTLNSFDRDLQSLRSEVVALAEQVGQELERAIDALLRGDTQAAQNVVDSDRRADALSERILLHTAEVLTRQQALADDLRAILAAGRIASHLERIGDYAKNTAKRSQRLAHKLDATLVAQFGWMEKRIRSMLARVIRAYQDDNADLANVAWVDDVELDAIYARIFAHLLASMQNNENSLPDGVQLLFIAKGLERAGDHVTDIAEEVFLKVTGAPLKGPRPKVDEAASVNMLFRS